MCQFSNLSNHRILILKYDSFKKDNRKNCWFQTCLLPSNFIVLINTGCENYGHLPVFIKTIKLDGYRRVRTQQF